MKFGIQFVEICNSKGKLHDQQFFFRQQNEAVTV